MGLPHPNMLPFGISAIEITIESMTCASWVGWVAAALRKVTGVGQVSVNLETAAGTY